MTENRTAYRLLYEIILAEATELAHAGHFAEAEASVAALDSEGMHRQETLDLLARIRAQQGRFDDAAEFWREVRTIDPGNEKARAALERIEREKRYGSLARRLSYGAIALGALVLVLVVVMPQIGKRRANSDLSTAREPLTSQSGPLAPHKPVELSEQLRVPGIIVQQNHKDAVITFTCPLFSTGTKFSPGAKELLSNLAVRLNVDKSAIVVVGATDRLPVRRNAVYRNNVDLGLARALKIADFLSAKTGMPSSKFALQSERAEVAGDHQEGSRTAIIHVKVE